MTLFGTLAVVLLVNGEPELARPVKVVVRGNTAFVANADTGTITALNVTSQKVMSSTKVAGSLSDMIVVAAADGLLATDAASGELLSLTIDNNRVVVSNRLRLHGADSVATNSAGTICVVSSKWGRRVSIVQVRPLKILHSVDLAFQPLGVLALEKNRFLVADAFGGDLAIVGEDGSVHAGKPLRGHNIRGLLLLDSEVLISHQKLSQVAQTDFADVHWGTLMQNVITRLPLDTLGTNHKGSKTVSIGDVERGSADPGALIKLSGGRVAVALAGVDEVLISPVPDKRGAFHFAEGFRFNTGARPVHLAATRDEQSLLVVNSLADSISVVPIPDRASSEWAGRRSDGQTGEIATLTFGNQRELTAAERGERQFFSGKLSHDGWLSCNSCHVDGHTSGLRADTMGDGSFGAAKLTPSLLGVRDTAPWGWSGNFTSLAEQVGKSVVTTMHGEADEAVSADIAAFLKTLQLPAVSAHELETTVAGEKLFTKHGCADCHQPGAFTSDKIVNVGFTDEVGVDRFNPPSLRGSKHRRAFFHDGRAKTLDQALKLHLPALRKDVSDADRRLLKFYLQSL